MYSWLATWVSPSVGVEKQNPDAGCRRSAALCMTDPQPWGGWLLAAAGLHTPHPLPVQHALCHSVRAGVVVPSS